MRRAVKWTIRGLIVLLLLPPLALAAANTDPGRRLAERLVAWASGGTVRIEGLHGRFPDTPRLRQVIVSDVTGPYLRIEDLALDWRPWRLVAGEARIDALTAAAATLDRMPDGGETAQTGGVPGLPVRVILARLHVARLTLAEPLAGHAVTVAVDGSADLRSLRDGSATLALRAGADAYQADLHLAADQVKGALSVREGAGGLLSRLADLPDLGTITASATLAGPLDRVALDLTARAGLLDATAQGTLPLTDGSADLAIRVTAPAMAPGPDLRWASIRLETRVRGALAAPSATGSAAIEGLKAYGASIASARVELSGDQRVATASATLEGLELPGPQPRLLAGAPLAATVSVRIADPSRPVRLTIDHPRVGVAGSGTLEPFSVAGQVTLPDLAPLAAFADVELTGSAALRVTVDHALDNAGDMTTLSARGPLRVTGGQQPVAGLIGTDGSVDVALTRQGRRITITRARIDGAAIGVTAAGQVAPDTLALDWTGRLADLGVLRPTLSGAIEARGWVKGPSDSLAAQAEITGSIAGAGYESGPITVRLDASSLPAAPRFRLEATGSLLDAPISVTVTGERRDAALRVAIDRSTWKSLAADGALSLPDGATIPSGTVRARMARLEDLAPLLGQSIRGAIEATIDADAETARARIGVTDLVLPQGVSLGRADLDATVTQAAVAPTLDATLTLGGGNAAGVAFGGKVSARGTMDALALSVTTDRLAVGGAPASVSADATLRAHARTLELAALRAGWKDQAVTLLAPARFHLDDATTIETLRLGLGSARLTVAGSVGRALDLALRLDDLPAALLSLADPSLAADGTVSGSLRLTGLAADPAGTLSVRGTGLRLREGPAASLPPATLSVDATLTGGKARTEARLALATSRLSVKGTVPIGGAGGLDLTGQGRIDLALTDPILTPSGRRARGLLDIDLAVTGPLAAPRPRGTLRLIDGDVRDVALGARLRDIAATVQADGTRLRLTQLRGRAGSGTIQATGSLSLVDGMPITLRARAEDARILTSHLVTATADADLTLDGAIEGPLTLGGTVRLGRTEIRIPERLPPSVATIPVRVAGAPAEPPPAPQGPPIALALTLGAPGQVFIRGRGVDAELGGRVTLGGTIAEPRPTGGFALRRGGFSILGQAFALKEGGIDFTGAGLANPSLRLVASARRTNLTADVTLSGDVRNPKVSFSSVPSLPQDEVLSALLFDTATTRLSPFQIAQLTNALAALSGGPSLGQDPLARVRAAVGLDRLTVGSDTSGGPVLEAGRTLAEGVYVGTRQGTTSGETQATIQVDIGAGVKLEATTSSGQTSATGATSAGSSSVGITYQLEY